MENLVASIHGLSRSEDNSEDLQQLLRLLETHSVLIHRELSNIDAVLARDISPAEHSLAFTFFLHVKSNSEEHGSGVTFLEQVETLVREGTQEQIQLASRYFVDVCDKYAVRLRERNSPKRGILPLMRAIRLVQDGKEYATGVHSSVLALCLLARCHRWALPLLEEDIYNVNPRNVTPKELMLYGYYGGLIMLGLRRYRESLELFDMAICTPARVLSQIVVESLQKRLLISLLVYGKHSLPHHIPREVERQYSAISATNALYQEFAKVFARLDATELRNFIASNAERLERDGNLGLAQQCVHSVGERKILGLTKCFITLSIEGIAKKVGLAKGLQAEAIIVRMIAERKIHAKLNKADGMVTFLDDPENYDSDEMRQLLDLQVRRSVALAQKLRALQETVELTPAFAAFASRQQRASEIAAGWGPDMDMLPLNGN